MISWISREVPAAVTRHKVWAGIVVVLAFLAVVIYLPRLPFVGPRSGREAESDFRGHLLTALGGLVLVFGAYYTARTFALNREGQITERFTRAVEQLAHEELEIRLGGIYALERIARDSETHYEPVIEVLTAFLREHPPWRPEGVVPSSKPTATSQHDSERRRAAQGRQRPRSAPTDVLTAAFVLGRRDRENRYERAEYRLDLRGVDMPRASLSNARLVKAFLSDANLFRANLVGANFSGANFSRAFLKLAYLSEAILSEAILRGADLRGADLPRAILSGADLRGTDLRRASLSGANFSGAKLFKAKLYDTDLSGALGLTQEQLDMADTDERTTPPKHLTINLAD